VDQNLIESEALDSARRGAIDAFECFSKVFDALQHHPEREVAASAVNPEAGDHPVPQDENLARIADDVGKKCHAAFGYLCRRYGSRGEAFARSDGAWMVTLGEIPILRAHKRIDWLAKLLSARGIPSLCLEQHLGMLHEALSNAHALPQNEPDRLLQLAHRVGARRRAVITEADWNKLIEIRVPALDPLGAATIISAIIDQRVGLAPCADSITGWLETCPTLESNDRCELLALFNHLGA
jgi:hypothetical protein